MNIVEVISTRFDQAKRRLVKFLRFGRDDVQETPEANPFGVDSNPISGFKAVYSETSERGEPVIVGYINTNLISTPGEMRIFSVDSGGNLSTFIHLRTDGTMEVAGASDNMVRFSELKTAFDELNSKFNSHLSNWNAFAAAYVPGGPAIQGTPPSATTSSTSVADIDPAKIDEVKTL